MTKEDHRAVKEATPERSRPTSDPQGPERKSSQEEERGVETEDAERAEKKSYDQAGTDLRYPGGEGGRGYDFLVWR